MRSVQYDIGSTHGMNFFYDKQFREVTVPTPRGDEIIPDPDSVPLSVLNHPVGKRHEIDFAAYDLPELTPTHTEGDHPVSVTCRDSFISHFNRKIGLECTMGSCTEAWGPRTL